MPATKTFDSIALALSRYSDKRLNTRRYTVQIGQSPLAVLDPSPATTDLSAKDIETIGGPIAGEGNAPSFGLRLCVPVEQLKQTIAAGLAEREYFQTGDDLAASREFYRYKHEPGSCLSLTPTPLNKAMGARWLVTHDTGDIYEYYVQKAELKHSTPYMLISLIRCYGHGGRAPVLSFDNAIAPATIQSDFIVPSATTNTGVSATSAAVQTDFDVPVAAAAPETFAESNYLESSFIVSDATGTAKTSASAAVVQTDFNVPNAIANTDGSVHAMPVESWFVVQSVVAYPETFAFAEAQQTNFIVPVATAGPLAGANAVAAQTDFTVLSATGIATTSTEPAAVQTDFNVPDATGVTKTSASAAVVQTDFNVPDTTAGIVTEATATAVQSDFTISVATTATIASADAEAVQTDIIVPDAAGTLPVNLDFRFNAPDNSVTLSLL